MIDRDADGDKRAFYARRGGWRADFWTLLHPPYTAWNLSYVVMGASLAPRLDWLRLALTLAAFLAGTGVASHALDELNGRPLKTGFTDRELKWLALVGLGAGFGAALVGAFVISPWILAWAVVGSALAAAYSLEWWGGIIHSGPGFALSWGAFPVLVGYWAQAETLSLPALCLALAAALLSMTQRSLSLPARFARRRAASAVVLFRTSEGETRWERQELLATWETPLRLLAWTTVSLAAGPAAWRW